MLHTCPSFGEDSASGTCLTGSLSSKDSQGVFHCGMPDVYGRAHLSLPMNICDPEKRSSTLLTQTERGDQRQAELTCAPGEKAS
ncbi:hypothetical protein MHYP_G00298610 [Metynnis hypsauchen]